MRLIDTRGVAVEVEPGLDTETRTVELARDVLIVKLRARGITFRVAGRILGISKQAAQQRFQRIPREAREFYGARPLDWLDSA